MAHSAGPLLLLLAFGGHATAQTLVESWYPLQPGNTWDYAKEILDGYVDHPDAERWTTEETVVSNTREAALDAWLSPRAGFKRLNGRSWARANKQVDEFGTRSKVQMTSDIAHDQDLND